MSGLECHGHVHQVFMRLWCLTSGLYNISVLYNTTPTIRDNCIESKEQQQLEADTC